MRWRLLQSVRDAFIKNSPYLDWQYVIVHHSGTPDPKLGYGDRWTFDTINDYHIRVLKYRAGAYNYVIDGDRVFYGRALDTTGAHSAVNRNRYFNEHGIGICVIGDYGITEPPENSLRKCLEIVKQTQILFDIPRDKVIGHREVYDILGYPRQKSCPGTKFDMAAFRSLCL